jgi:hypothetical protein
MSYARSPTVSEKQFRMPDAGVQSGFRRGATVFRPLKLKSLVASHQLSYRCRLGGSHQELSGCGPAAAVSRSRTKFQTAYTNPIAQR